MAISDLIEVSARQYTQLQRLRVKAKYHYTCAKCGSTEYVQAHAPKGDHTNWEDGIALCGNCHADEHPNIPRALFLTSKMQPCWPNMSAASLARKFDCHSRTVIRNAKKLSIPRNKPISKSDIKKLQLRVKKGYSDSADVTPKGRQELSCPECGGTHLVKYGKRFKRNDDGKRERVQQYLCKDCGRITHKPVVKSQ